MYNMLNIIQILSCYIQLKLNVVLEQNYLYFPYILKCDYFIEKRKSRTDKKKKKYFKNYNILNFGTLMNLTKKTMHTMSGLMAEKCNSLSLSRCKYCI